MKATRKPRYTIGQLMLWIAFSAGLLAIPRLIHSPDRPVLFWVAGILVGLALLNALIELTLGLQCPECGRMKLRRLARHPGYYRCMACRAQVKRVGFGRWLDASGPEDAARYGRRSEAGVWKEFEVPRDLKGSNSGALLGSKRTRDLLDEVKQHPSRPVPTQPIEQARRKVRDFLARRRDPEE